MGELILRESMSFTYDGVSSVDFGVMMINEGGGLYRDLFIPTRKVVEKSVAGNDRSYFKRIERQQVTFDMTILIQDWKNKKTMRDISRWFDQEWYKPLWFESNPNRIYYALIENDSEIIHNGLMDGYLKVKVRCNSAYSYSQELKYIKQVRGAATTNIYNDGDESCFPLLKIKKIGNGDIVIKTTLEDEKKNEMIIKDLLDGELVEIDCETQDISTNYEDRGRYIFDNHNDDWLEFGVGSPYDGDASTKIEFAGDFDLEMIYQYRYLTD